jgi:hypothetical protein
MLSLLVRANHIQSEYAVGWVTLALINAAGFIWRVQQKLIR